MKFEVHDYMFNNLNLKGNQVLLYALIRNYTIIEGGYKGTLKQLQKELSLSKPTAISLINHLTEAGLVIRNEAMLYVPTDLLELNEGKETLPIVNNVKIVGKETLPLGSEEIKIVGKETLPHISQSITEGKEILPFGKETLPYKDDMKSMKGKVSLPCDGERLKNFTVSTDGEVKKLYHEEEDEVKKLDQKVKKLYLDDTIQMGSDENRDKNRPYNNIEYYNIYIYSIYYNYNCIYNINNNLYININSTMIELYYSSISTTIQKYGLRKDVDVYTFVLRWLEERSGKGFEVTNEIKKMIDKVLGTHPIEVLMYVIDKKVKDWKGTKYSPGLNPKKLLGTDFEKWLTEKAYSTGQSTSPTESDTSPNKRGDGVDVKYEKATGTNDPLAGLFSV